MAIRLGGLRPDQSANTDSRGAAAVADSICLGVEDAEYGPSGLVVGATAGVATLPDHGRTSAELFAAADAAMYAARRRPPPDRLTAAVT